MAFISGSLNFPLFACFSFSRTAMESSEDKGDLPPPQTGIAPLPDLAMETTAVKSLTLSSRKSLPEKKS